MAKFKNKYRIESNRWRYWDYSAPGNYFITICIINRQCILGHVVDGKMELSEYGEIVKSEILKIPEYHKRVKLDEWVVMPKQINILRNTPGVKNWQHDYHDHVIRNEVSYWYIKNYIIENPSKWKEDTFYDSKK